MTRLAAADRRAMLLDAALRVIARDGIAEATTRAITAEAGMPQSVFHYCFRSKDELLRELITVTVAELADRAELPTHPLPDIEQSVRAGLHALWKAIIDPPDKQLVLYEITTYALRNPELADLARQQYAGYLHAANRSLTAWAEQAGVRWTVPVPILARLLVTVIDGLGLSWLTDHDSAAALAVIDQFAAHLATLAEPLTTSSLHAAPGHATTSSGAVERSAP